VKPVGAIPNGSATVPPSTLVDVSTCETSLRMDGVELDVLERLAGARQRELVLGRAVGVVERCPGVRRFATARRS
jgi:hypothetical protein